MPITLSPTTLRISPSSDGKLYGSNPDGDAGSSWPVNGYHAEGQYTISGQDDILDTYASITGLKDLVLYQWRYPSSSNLATEYANLSALRVANANIKLIRYSDPGEVKKSPTAFEATRVTYDLINGADGNSNWYLRNTAGTIVEAKFSPTTLYKCNEAAHIAGNNASGETYAEAYHRVWANELNSGSILDVIDGVYHDVTPPRPQQVYLNNGSTSTNMDYNQDGSADSRTDNTVGATDDDDGGARMFRRGVLEFITAAKSNYGASMVYPGNGGRDGLDYLNDLNLPRPISDCEWYGQWDGRVAEEPNGPCGLYPTGTGYEVMFNGLSSTIARCLISEAFLVSQAAHPWGYPWVLYDFYINNRTPTADDYAYARWQAFVVRGLPKAIYGGKRAMNVPFPQLDEHAVDCGNRAAGWESWGALNEADVSFSIRSADYANAGAEFHWFEFDNVLWVGRTDYPGAGAWPSGAAATCNLPDPGAGKVWRRLTGTQDSSVNDGTECTGGIYGQVTLKPWHAIMVQRVDS